MIESHLPLVRAVANRYAGRGEALDDLVQVGAVGLIKASDRFDADRGVSFASFATPAVEGEIRRHLGDRASSLRLPRELQRITGQLRRCRDDLGNSLGRLPTVTELADALGVPESDIERGIEAERARHAISISSDTANELAADDEPLEGSDDRLLLAGGMRELDERERSIVFLRFHADMTEREIGRVVGISQAQVSRTLAGALVKLKEQLASRPDIASATAAGSDIAPAAAISPDAGETSVTEPRGGSDATTRLAPVVGAQDEAEHAGRGETPGPAPRSPKRKPAPKHSGRFLVRMPSELHEELALAAEREHVSLNRFITDRLAASLADEAGAESSCASDERAPEGGAGTANEPASESVVVSANEAPEPGPTREPGPTPEPRPTPEPTREGGARLEPAPVAERSEPRTAPRPDAVPEPGAVGAPEADAPVAGPDRARALRVALAANLIVVVFAGAVAIALLVLAVQRGI